MLFFVLFVLFFLLAVILFTQLPPFGRPPAGERLARIRRSPNYREGKFQNENLTLDLSENVTYWDVTREYFFTKKPRLRPERVLPSRKTDLHALAPGQNVLVWFGHSSYFLQVDGKKILVDPVLSGTASPLPNTNRSFPGTDVYTLDDLTDLDYLFISHDHWDHLDHATVSRLRPRVRQVFCGLGTGAHLERWGYTADQIVEKDWEERITPDPGFTVEVLPARHFSGRSFRRNRALWVSFALSTPNRKIYLGGDSGYDEHFARIGREHGPFDLVILECGQYDKSWKYIHLMPEEVVQAARDLRAARLLPVHWGKFVMANHPWDEPILRVAAAARQQGMPLVTPLIGEEVDLENLQESGAWWVPVAAPVPPNPVRRE